MQACRVIDRFHVQKLALEAVQEIRIKHRWEAIDADTEAREQAKLNGLTYVPERLENGDTLKELLARGRYAIPGEMDSSTAAESRDDVRAVSRPESGIQSFPEPEGYF